MSGRFDDPHPREENLPPMPLKHHTETVLIGVLCVLTALTGVVVSSLPILPLGLIPWGIVFLLTLLYPFALYPLLRRHRADYEFRALHFAPAIIAGAWFLLQAATLKAPALLKFHSWFTWGHTFFPVVLTLVLLALFSLHVIRRWIPRLAVIGVIGALFFGLAAYTESGGRLDDTLASTLWSSDRWQTAINGTIIAGRPVPAGSGKNLAASENAEEEAWRARLRAVESNTGALSSSSQRSSGASSYSSSSTPPEVAAKPGRLPSSGAGAEAFLPLFFAGYFGIVHTRAAKRAKA